MKRILFIAALAAGTTIAGAQRPQDPVPPFPYNVEEVVFTNPEVGITLAGTLTTPLATDDDKNRSTGKRNRSADGKNRSAGERKFPAVVLLTGSGAQNRDEELFNHRPFAVLADHLTRRGIAVLRFDDRGVGGSQKGPEGATTADFATDAAAAIEFLRTRPQIDPSRTGLAGHSEGATVAFMTAADHPDRVAFVVSLGGPGVSGREVSVMQVVDIAAAQGVPEAMKPAVEARQRRDLGLIVDNAPEFVEANVDSIATIMVPTFATLPEATRAQVQKQIIASNGPWARFFMTHDPAGDLARVRCPVLALGGSKDLQVRASVNLPAIAAALASGGNTRCTVREYEGLNHMFQTAATGHLNEYAAIDQTLAPQVLNDIADWIAGLR